MLIQIAFFIVMLVGLAALYVDLGSVRLTQSLMQNAADTAAIEGLRQRDSMSEEDRRTAADTMVTRTFSDPAGDRNMGLGSVITLGNQRTDLGDANASQCYNPSLETWTKCESDTDPGPLAPSGFYRPTLELNLYGAAGPNQPHGDIVSGKFQPTSGADLAATNGTTTTSLSHQFIAADVGHSLRISGGTGWVAGEYTIDSVSAGAATLDGSACGAPPCAGGVWAETGALEDSTYARLDFIPDDAGKSAFLVRLRRTDGRNGLDNDAGVSQSGPSVPLLFGRGVLTYDGDPRRYGLTVRATAIADARPAVRVGSPGPGRPGSTSFALTHEFWAGLANGGTYTLTQCDPAGHLRSPCTSVVTAGEVYSGSLAQVVGTQLAAGGAVGDLPLQVAYVPIYDETGVTANRVIGFGYAQVTADGAAATITITVTRSLMASQNASALVTAATPPGVVAANRSLEFALLAPVIVR